MTYCYNNCLCNTAPKTRCCLDTIYRTLEVSQSSTAAYFTIPKCANDRCIFFVKINNEVPTSVLPVYITICTTSYPIVDSLNNVVTTDNIITGFVYEMAKTDIGGTKYIQLLNYIVTSSGTVLTTQESSPSYLGEA